MKQYIFLSLLLISVGCEAQKLVKVCDMASNGTHDEWRMVDTASATPKIIDAKSDPAAKPKDNSCCIVFPKRLRFSSSGTFIDDSASFVASSFVTSGQWRRGRSSTGRRRDAPHRPQRSWPVSELLRDSSRKVTDFIRVNGKVEVRFYYPDYYREGWPIYRIRHNLTPDRWRIEMAFSGEIVGPCCDSSACNLICKNLYSQLPHP